MPYKVKGRCIYKKDTGAKVGCTTGSVKKYLAALHANVHDEGVKKITQKDVMAGIRKSMPPPVTTHKSKKTYDRKKFKSFKDYFEDVTGLDGSQKTTDDTTVTAEDNSGAGGYGSGPAGCVDYGAGTGEFPDNTGISPDPEMAYVSYEAKKKKVKASVVNKAIKYLLKFVDKEMPNQGEDLDKFLKDLKTMADDLAKAGVEPVDIIATIKQPNMAKQYLIRGPSAPGGGGKGALQDLMDLRDIEILEDEDTPTADSTDSADVMGGAVGEKTTAPKKFYAVGKVNIKKPGEQPFFFPGTEKIAAFSPQQALSMYIARELKQRGVSDNLVGAYYNNAVNNKPNITELPPVKPSDTKQTYWWQDFDENFMDGKHPGRKGLAKRSGVNTKASVSTLRNVAKHSSGEKARMAHWLANMKAGKAKHKHK